MHRRTLLIAGAAASLASGLRAQAAHDEDHVGLGARQHLVQAQHVRWAGAALQCGQPHLCTFGQPGSAVAITSAPSLSCTASIVPPAPSENAPSGSSPLPMRNTTKLLS